MLFIGILLVLGVAAADLSLHGEFDNMAQGKSAQIEMALKTTESDKSVVLKQWLE